MPLIPKITTYNTQIIPAMYQEGWQIVSIYDDKIFWHKEVKQSRTPKIAGDDFSDFYKLYPNKKGKENARVMWTRLTEKERELAHSGLIRYIAYWKQKEIEKQFLPHPATWLHQKRWEDDLSDNVILSKPVENLQKEIDQDKEIEKERKWNEQQLAKLKAEGKWESEYAKARDSLPEGQRKYERIIIAKMITNIRNP